jgi:cell division protein FtsZ
VVAALAKELNALTVAVVTKPFTFEGPRRLKQADRGLADLASTVDTVISIPNDKLLDIVPKGTSFFDAFRTADDVLRQAVQGISDIITTPGIINRDFSDIRAIMLGMGYAMMGTATCVGERAAVSAAAQAITCALLEDGGVKGAKGILINITGSSRLSLHDINEACELIRAAAENDDVQINWGIVMNEAMGEEVKITVIATGFQRANLPLIDRSSSVNEGRMISGPPSMLGHSEHSAIVTESARADMGPMIMPPISEQPMASMESIPATATVLEAKAEEQTKNDLEMPAFLRRERRLFQ